jgi:hypothetical protein
LPANRQLNIEEDPSIPIIKDWTVEKVYQYFSDKFPDKAIIPNALKNCEINGDALLCLRRSEVVDHLGLNLGCALHLYCEILKLQTRSGDPTLTWRTQYTQTSNL